MQFWQSLALTEMDELIELAKVAEDVGFAGITLSDHLATPETLRTRYPYTDDGKPMWATHDAFPDPWILIAAMAQETTRIRFMPFVYVLPMRDPFSVAKLVASAAVLSQDRVVLGVGTGWMEEEFALVDRDFKRRGKRTDEMLEVIAKLHAGGFVDHAGEFFRFEGVHMAPAPNRPIEVRIGGLEPVALRRAARHDGWLGLNHTVDEITKIVATLDGERRRLGRSDRPFDIMIAHSPAGADNTQHTQHTQHTQKTDNTARHADGVAEYERYRDAGVTSVNVPPWRYRGISSSSFDEKRRSLEDFAERYIVPLAG